MPDCQMSGTHERALDALLKRGRLRSLEPTGLVKLAAAQLHEKQFEAASETVKQLRSRNWPSRFDQLPNQLRELEERLNKRESK